MVDEESREVSVLEMACTFDLSLEEAFMAKVIKYQPLLHTISKLGYRCRLFVFIFGSLGHTHRLVVKRVPTTWDAQKGGKKAGKVLCCVCYDWQPPHMAETLLLIPIEYCVTLPTVS